MAGTSSEPVDDGISTVTSFVHDCDDADPAVHPGAVEVADLVGGTYSVYDTDCDDVNSQVRPDMPESPDNQIDDDCNGVVDDGL